MKTVVVYHSVDLDGWMSAAIVKHWFETDKQEIITGQFLYRKDVDVIDFIGYNYGQPIPDLSEYDKVIMCDISFPKDEMLKLRSNLGGNFIWIDHHISAIKDNIPEDHAKPMFAGIQDTKFAACELTWKYFFPNEDMPEIVRLLGRYDCFGHKGTDEEQKVLEFQYGARRIISNYEEAYTYLQKSLEGVQHYDYCGQYTIEDDIHQCGRNIYSYLCTEAKQIYKNGFEIESIERFTNTETKKYISGIDPISYKFICINKERFNPINFGIDYHKDGYDGVACFHYANSKWNFSLYNNNGEVDCSQIAKQYSGGGHRGASGFVCDNDTFLKIINNG